MGLNRYIQPLSLDQIKRNVDPQIPLDYLDILDQSKNPLVDPPFKKKLRAELALNKEIEAMYICEKIEEYEQLSKEKKTELEESYKKELADANLLRERVNEATKLLNASYASSTKLETKDQQKTMDVFALSIPELTAKITHLQQKMAAVQQNINAINKQMQQIGQRWQQRRQAIHTNFATAVASGTIQFTAADGTQLSSDQMAQVSQVFNTMPAPTPFDTKMRITGIDGRIQKEQEEGTNTYQLIRPIVRYENTMQEMDLLMSLATQLGYTVKQTLTFRRNNGKEFDEYASRYLKIEMSDMQDIKDLFAKAQELGAEKIMLGRFEGKCTNYQTRLQELQEKDYGPRVVEYKHS